MLLLCCSCCCFHLLNIDNDNGLVGLCDCKRKRHAKHSCRYSMRHEGQSYQKPVLKNRLTNSKVHISKHWGNECKHKQYGMLVMYVLIVKVFLRQPEP